MNRLAYMPVHFFLHFQQAVSFQRNPEPVFVLRSVLGYNLRPMCCIARNAVCASCMYNQTCAYSYIFETILPQKNAVRRGTDRASHPYAMTQCRKAADGECSDYDFTITLFGKAIDYLPYIYAAFARAGKYGLFKERIPYEITDVQADNGSLLIDGETIRTDTAPLIWAGSTKMEKGAVEEVLVELRSQLRFKTRGKYTLDFSAEDFMLCLYRRMRTLCILYGEYDEESAYVPEQVTCSRSDAALSWIDATHYSARQKKAMALGGICGTFKLIGTFSPFEKSLLTFNKICNAGKNTNFGLGQLDFWERQR